MKKSLILICFLLIKFSMVSGRAPASDTLRITSTPDLYNLASKWAEEFSSGSSDLKIKYVIASDSRQASDNIRNGMLGFVTSKNYQEISDGIIWHSIVARDVIVPVMNSHNPSLDKVLGCGISPEMFLKITNSKTGIPWGSIIPDAENAPVHYYWTNDASTVKALTAFMGTDKINQAGTEVENYDALVASVKKDQFGVGFCKITEVADLNYQTVADGLCLLPIDRNNNGVLDYNERIYNDFSQFTRGVWIGKYPKSLSSGIYAASISGPDNTETLEFLRWVLTDGQKYLYENGYNDLLLTERVKTLDQLNNAKVYTAAGSGTSSPFLILFLLSAAVLILVLSSYKIVSYVRQGKLAKVLPVKESDKIFGESAISIPGGVYFDKTHTWAFMEQDGFVKVGIDDFLQHITGSITRINMKKDGTRVQKGEQILSLVQNGKHLDLYAPVSGVIRAHNSILETSSCLLNSSPYNEGWVYRIEPSNWHRENQLLFHAEKYREYIRQEFSRLKDFLASVLSKDDVNYTKVVLQDGGDFREGVLSQMGPEIWEDFQVKYIDPSRQIWFYELF